MHVMIDLETLDLRPTAVILSIGAVAFTENELPTEQDVSDCLEGQMVPQAFYRNCEFELGWFTISKETHAWWCARPKEQRAELAKNKAPLESALREFYRWMDNLSPKPIGVWSNGAAFDLPILQHAFAEFGMATPWNYRVARDTRTLSWLAKEFVGQDVSSVNLGTNAHNALWDAWGQARRVQYQLKEIRRAQSMTAMVGPLPGNPDSIDTMRVGALST